MDVSLSYCVNCLKKFIPDFNEETQDSLYFFTPTIDMYGRNHFIYVCMSAPNARHVFAGAAGNVIQLSDYANILHVEEGGWPDAERQKEIRDFYHLAMNYSHAQHRYAA